MPTRILYLDDGSPVPVSIMDHNGYVDATRLGQIAKIRLDNWWRNKGTKTIIKLLAQDLQIPENDLTIVRKGGKTGIQQGTWIHPRLAIHFAMFCSTSFGIQVSGWVEEWMDHDSRNRFRFDDALQNIKTDKDEYQTREKNIQERLHQELGGEIEVETSVGFIDLLTPTEIIEIKHTSSWKHAVGQVLMYAVEYPRHQKRVHIFGENEKTNMTLIRERSALYSIRVTFEDVQSESNELDRFKAQALP